MPVAATAAAADLTYSNGTTHPHGLEWRLPAGFTVFEIQSRRALDPASVYTRWQLVLVAAAGCSVEGTATVCNMPPEDVPADLHFRIRGGLGDGGPLTQWEPAWHPESNRIECCRYATGDVCVVRATDGNVFYRTYVPGSQRTTPLAPMECSAPQPVRPACQ